MTATAAPARVPAAPKWTPAQRYRRSLWLLTTRDLRVRYSTNALGWLWSVLDPLLMAAIYWFVFTQVFQRGVDHPPYIVFLLTGLLPWTWFSGSINDAAKAFSRDAKLIRSTTIPRSIWVTRIVLSKGIEFLFSLPVLVLFVVVSLFTSEPARLDWQLVFFPLAIALQAVLTTGIGLIVAPLVVFFRDLERAVRLILRFGFYATPIIFSLGDLGHLHPALRVVASLNPLAGIVGIYRAGFFDEPIDWVSIVIGTLVSLVLLGVGMLVFRRTVPAVLKEI